METHVCVCGASALELYRSSRRLIPELLDKPRTGQVAGLGMAPRLMLADDMTRLGVSTKPYHLLIGGRNAGRQRDDVIRHAYSQLPPRALIRIDKTCCVASPELTFIQLAASGAYDDIELIELGFELCGTYVLDSSWDGFTCTDEPLTSVEKIERMAARLRNHAGLPLAKRALKHVRNFSNSPMETVLALLVSLPTSQGGLGLGPIAMNQAVRTAAGTRHVDVGFPNHKLGLEYMGKQYHSIEAAGRDDRRQNKLVGSGFTVLNVWYEDLVNEHLFQQFTDDLFHAMGKRRRIRAKGYAMKQRVLRAYLMPAVERFGLES